MSCFVPSCNNTIGSLFPDNENEREMWLRCLNLEHLEPMNNSFVCFNHFRECDLEMNDDNSTVLKSAAVPRIIVGATNNSVSSEMCRVCASEDDLVMKITEPLEGGDIPIMSILMQCCYPVKMSPTDNLPKDICSSCLNDLKTAHKLRTRCLDSIKKIHIKIEKQNAFKRKQAQELRLQEEIKKRKEIPEPGIELVEIKKKIKIVNAPGTSKNLIGQKIMLPLVALEQYASPLGKFDCTVMYKVLNATFYQADNYIYSIGLRKKSIRTLHCVVPQCVSIASQKLLPNNLYEECIEVLKPHIHPVGSDDDRKKHMFFHVMRKRVQYDKSLNIKNLYEEFCKMEPSILNLIPLRNVINEICKSQMVMPNKEMTSFETFYKNIENLHFSKLHFTSSGKQFYQEKFACDGCLAVIFSNREVLEKFSNSELMYVDASFKIDTNEDFKYQLVTVLLWIKDTYYPVLFAFINKKSQEIFKKIFQHLQQDLAPNLKPKEIVTDFEANLYYALAETYYDSNIGGSIFYYTQNLYKKVCSLNLSRDLETNSYFRSIYHMLLMLPLLPVNTILDGFSNVEVQAKQLGLVELSKPLFDHVREQWINNVTADLFCVHRLENRINENVIAPLKKLRDFLLLSKGKPKKDNITITQVVEKLIDLEAFLNELYKKKDKKSFGRDLSSSQKRNVLRAWHYIECNPKININNFFTKVLGYIKCMENQLWIWGFYRYIGDGDDELINASNFSIIGVENEADMKEGELNDQDISKDPEEDQYIEECILDEAEPNQEFEEGMLVDKIKTDQEFNVETTEEFITNINYKATANEYHDNTFAANACKYSEERANYPTEESTLLHQEATNSCPNEQVIISKYPDQGPIIILNDLLNQSEKVVVEMKSMDLINIGEM